MTMHAYLQYLCVWKTERERWRNLLSPVRSGISLVEVWLKLQSFNRSVSEES